MSKRDKLLKIFGLHPSARMRKLISDAMAQEEEDGGPGSGNWGHKGRIGKVGGSGKGGGKRYRSTESHSFNTSGKSGGSKEGVTRYFGTRGDWMNGLSGEEQHSAHKFLESVRKKIPEADPKKVESSIMTMGSESDKKRLLDFKGKSRHWDDIKAREIYKNEFLSDKEKTVLNYLEDKYTGGDGFNEEDAFSAMTDGEKDAYLKLKDKALEGKTFESKEITEGIDDELAYEVGIKERPKPKGSLSYGWMGEGDIDPADYNETTMRRLALASTDKLESITPLLGKKISADQVDAWEKHMAENGFAEAEKSFSHYYTMADFLSDKGKALGFGDMAADAYAGDLNAFMVNGEQTLTADEAKTLLDLYRKYGVKPFEPGGFFNAERMMLRNHDKYDIQTMIALKNKALGGYEMEVTAKAPATEAEIKTTMTKMMGKIKDAKSTDDVSRILNESGCFSKSCDISAISDIGIAKSAAESYNKIVSEFPEIYGKFASMDSSDPGGGAYASCSMGTGVVHIGSKYFKGDLETIKRTYEKDLDFKFHPEGTTWESIVTHEFAHGIDGYYTRKFGYSWTAPFSNKVFTAVRKSLKMSSTDVWNAVSKYATKSYSGNDKMEWFAEAIAEALHSPSPRPVAVECLKQAKLIIERGHA